MKIFKVKLDLETEPNHMLVSEVENQISTEKIMLNSPYYF